jgi:FkbH-like protein
VDVQLVATPWLADPPADFRHQVHGLLHPLKDNRNLARHLSGFRLSGNQLHTLASPIEHLAATVPDAIRLGVLSNFTTDLIRPALSVAALRHGVWLRTIGTAFNQIASEALDPNSQLNRAQCQYILLAVDHHGLPLIPTPGNLDRARESVATALGFVSAICKGLHKAAQCVVLVQTVPQVPQSFFGNAERNIPGTLQWLIDHYNADLRSVLTSSSDLLVDTASLAESVGLASWHDHGQWTLGKFPFSQHIVPLYADHIGRLVAAARGRTRKCLVLDLDNTLWGGVIGDDGIEGIVLGNGSPTGEAFLLTQQVALALRERGIVLAVSSKNDDLVARTVFRSHPEMLLKEHHITVFQANWNDKASNLKAIAETLNFGLDALVLLDDNPAERAQVRLALPEVAVPEIPEDPALHGTTLLAAGYFESISFTNDDRERAERYHLNAARAELRPSATDLGAYLRSLEMKLICKPFDHLDRARITQLINKSNQFNLTTRRYTEAQVAALEESAVTWTAQMRLIDRFGDNGIVAIVICNKEGARWLIDTWLMSCRVLNRQVEQATLGYIVSHARAQKVDTIIGQYLATERNSMVKDHYAKLNFSPLIQDSSSSRWQLNLESYTPPVVPIEIVYDYAS